MHASKRKKVEARGWKVGSATNFLNLIAAEASTLRKKIANLPAKRRTCVKARAELLVAEERSLQALRKTMARPRKARGEPRTNVRRFESVWDAIANSPAEAANLRLRSELMMAIGAIIQKSGWTQTETAEHCGITQPRVNDLLRGRISRFSLDALVNIAASLGRRVHVALKAA